MDRMRYGDLVVESVEKFKSEEEFEARIDEFQKMVDHGEVEIFYSENDMRARLTEVKENEEEKTIDIRFGKEDDEEN